MLRLRAEKEFELWRELRAREDAEIEKERKEKLRFIYAESTEANSKQ